MNKIITMIVVLLAIGASGVSFGMMGKYKLPGPTRTTRLQSSSFGTARKQVFSDLRSEIEGQAVKNAFLTPDILIKMGVVYGFDKELGATCRYMNRHYVGLEGFGRNNPQWMYFDPKPVRQIRRFDALDSLVPSQSSRNNEKYLKAFSFAIDRDDTDALGCFLSGIRHAPVNVYEDGLKQAVQQDREKAFVFLAQNYDGSSEDYECIMKSIDASVSIKHKYAHIWSRYHGNFLKDSAENQHCTIL